MGRKILCLNLLKYLGIFLIALVPAQAAAQWMAIDMNTTGSTQNGHVAVNTAYDARVGAGIDPQVRQNQYVNKVQGFGSPITVANEFSTNPESEIAAAGLFILKLPAEGPFSSLTATEKIGTESVKTDLGMIEYFAGAGGSWILVTETEHATAGSTEGGKTYYLVQSAGLGTMSAGLAGDFVRLEGPPPATAAELLSLCAQMGLFPVKGGQPVVAAQDPGAQRFTTQVRYSGCYSGRIEGIIAPPAK